MEHILIAQKRETQKRTTKRLRKTGKIPAIVYGSKKTPIPIHINARAFKKQFSHISESVIIMLKIDGEDDKDVLIKQYDFDNIVGRLQHIDFYEIERGKELNAQVEIIPVGNCEGLRLGGILEHFLHEVEVTCLPKNLPQTIEVDITNLHIGGALHVSDLPKLTGVKYTAAETQTVLHIATPKVADLEPSTEEAAVEAKASQEEAKEG